MKAQSTERILRASLSGLIHVEVWPCGHWAYVEAFLDLKEQVKTGVVFLRIGGKWIGWRSDGSIFSGRTPREHLAPKAMLDTPCKLQTFHRYFKTMPKDILRAFPYVTRLY